jgi:hypothetical protein
MDACTSAGIWRLSFMAVHEEKSQERPKLRKERGL